MAPPRKNDRPKPTPSPLALRIQQARISSGIETDAAFAKEVGVDGRAYWRWTTENAEPSARMLKRIAEVGKVDLGWLIGDDEPAQSDAEQTIVTEPAA